MKEKENVVAAVIPNTYIEEAQTRMQFIRQMREVFPRLVIPASPKDSSRLNSAASVPPEFVELTAVAITNENALVRGDGMPPAEIRDLAAYADAFGPFADELEAFAQFVRHSVNTARNTVGSEALTTYALAQRLAKRPKHAHLAPYVADMRRALGRVRKLTAEERAQRAAAKQAAKTPPATTTTQTS
jgi:hypothetical protein